MPGLYISTEQQRMDNYAQFLQEQAAVNQMYAEMRARNPSPPTSRPT